MDELLDFCEQHATKVTIKNTKKYQSVSFSFEPQIEMKTEEGKQLKQAILNHLHLVDKDE